MEKRRKETRRIIGRGFDNNLELDFKPPTVSGLNGLGLGVNGDRNQNPTGTPAAAGGRGRERRGWDTTGGGRNQRGREAVAHNFL